MAKKLYRFHRDFGRMGELEGIFTEEEEIVNKIFEVPYKVYFGEVLGKHSEVYCKINPDDILKLTDVEEAVNVVDKYDLQNGYNPFGETFLNLDYEEIGLDEDNEYLVHEVLKHMIENEKKDKV